MPERNFERGPMATSGLSQRWFDEGVPVIGTSTELTENYKIADGKRGMINGGAAPVIVGDNPALVFKRLCRLLFPLFSFFQLLRQVAMTLAVHGRIAFINTKLMSNVFLVEVKINTNAYINHHLRNNDYGK